MTPSAWPPLLAGLRGVPGGFGQPDFPAFAAAFLGAAHRAAADRAAPPVLFVMGEPLAGKSTFLSALFGRLTAGLADGAAGAAVRSAGDGATPAGAGGLRSGRPDSAAGPDDDPGAVRPYLVRWGDTIRAGKKVGAVAAERQFGDLTAEEFARTSGLLAEAAGAARAAATGQGPAVVVVEAPGLTMLADADGRTRGLDRGYSFARALAGDPGGYLLALCAEARVRDAHLAARHAQLTAGGPDVREATQLAANRIRAQVADLLYELAQAGAIRLPEPAPPGVGWPPPGVGWPPPRATLDDDPAYRTEAVLRSYLPYLLRDDLGVPPGRAFIALNGYQDGSAGPDLALLDRYDWTHPYFGI